MISAGDMDIRLNRNKQERRAANWSPMPNMSTESDSEDIDELRVSKTIRRGVSRDDFLLSYLNDIRGGFGLSDGQVKILYVLTSSNEYKSQFKWTTDKIVAVSKATELKISNVKAMFSLLVCRKGLVLKEKKGFYRLNENVLFHRARIGKAEKVQLSYVYRFQDASLSIESLLEKGVEIPLELVEQMDKDAEERKKQALILRQLYNDSQREKLQREKEAKNKEADKKKREDELSKNKWE